MPASFFQAAVASAFTALLRPVYGGIGCLLALYRVIPEEERSAFTENRARELTPDSLREILRWIRARGLEPIALDAVPERLAKPRGRKFVAFTFDDGYRDNLVHALPIFREFDIPFTVNITTGFIAGIAAPWWYALEDLLVSGGRLTFSWREQAYDFRCRSQEAREEAFHQLARMIRAAGAGAREELLDLLFSGANGEALVKSKSLMLTWRGVRALAAEPLVTIGAHSVGHQTLNLLSEEEARSEICGAKSELEAHLHHEVRHLAFPFGGRHTVGAREFRLARECGFATAVTTRSANLFKPHARFLHSLPRLVVSGNYYPASKRFQKLESGEVAALEQRWRRVVTE